MSSGDKTADKYLEAQIEEIEVLRSIYGDEWKLENEYDRSYSIEIKQDNLSVTLYVTLSGTYPYDSPPTYTISAPGINRELKNELTNQLEEVYLQNIGQTVLFQWIDKIKEFLATLGSNDSIINEEPVFNSACETSKSYDEYNLPVIVHGETIVDRKSTFQGHVAIVLSVDDVRLTLIELQKNRKIADATHNMYAYRIKNINGSILQDCDDDGEKNAGGRLLHLLQILNVSNVLVVVSRWYGGIHLGADRFRHINNAARQVIEQAGLLNCNKNKEKN